MTWGELIAQARFLLQDLRENEYRYSDENLLAACHLACTTAKQIRPDLFYGKNLLTGDDSPCFPPPPYDGADIPAIKALTSPFPENYVQPVILFMTGYAEVVNEEFSDGSRATSLLSSFKNQLSRVAT